jgi:hypothetical protein
MAPTLAPPFPDPSMFFGYPNYPVADLNGNPSMAPQHHGNLNGHSIKRDPFSSQGNRQPISEVYFIKIQLLIMIISNIINR